MPKPCQPPSGERKHTSNTEGVTVLVRVRPPIYQEIQQENAVNTSGGQTITVHSEKYDVQCSYHKVFDQVTDQQQVFQHVQPLLTNVLAGYNACIFAYGQTSAGKSHTMLGPNGGILSMKAMDKEQWGLIPRAAEYLFGELYKAADEGNLSYKVKASYVQIYNENLYDLLSVSGPAFDDNTSAYYGKGHENGLKIREIPIPPKKGEPAQHEVYISGRTD